MKILYTLDDQYLREIRNRSLDLSDFRERTRILAHNILENILEKIPLERHKDIVPVIILRAGVVFLEPLLNLLPRNPIGFLGMKRDETTARAEIYHKTLPKLTADSIILILDPMLATAGTLQLAIDECNRALLADADKIDTSRQTYYFAGFIASARGLRIASLELPPQNIFILAVDPELDARQFIVPGLGDFGDRFLGC